MWISSRKDCIYIKTYKKTLLIKESEKGEHYQANRIHETPTKIIIQRKRKREYLNPFPPITHPLLLLFISLLIYHLPSLSLIYLPVFSTSSFFLLSLTRFFFLLSLRLLLFIIFLLLTSSSIALYLSSYLSFLLFPLFLYLCSLLSITHPSFSLFILFIMPFLSHFLIPLLPSS